MKSLLKTNEGLWKVRKIKLVNPGLTQHSLNAMNLKILPITLSLSLKKIQVFVKVTAKPQNDPMFNACMPRTFYKS